MQATLEVEMLAFCDTHLAKMRNGFPFECSVSKGGCGKSYIPAESMEIT
jgi:hypothetical protein